MAIAAKHPAPVMGVSATAAVRRPRVVAPSRLGPRRAALAAAIAAAAILAAYLAWFRDSSLVSVDRVDVHGLTAPGTGRIRAELTAAARRMTSLDVEEGALRAAVAHDALVRSLTASGSFPHTLTIDVVLNVPVARLTAGGASAVVAGDGTRLPSAGGAALPTIALPALPAAAHPLGAGARAQIAAAAAEPGPLRARTQSIATVAGTGIVARLAGGVSVLLGDGRSLAAKWAAAAAVLAQPSSAGASYVDVRLPSRPVAGGLTLAHPPQPDAALSTADPAAPGVIAATSGPGATASGPAANASGPAATAPAGPATATTAAVPVVPSAASAAAVTPAAAAPSNPQPGH